MYTPSRHPVQLPRSDHIAVPAPNPFNVRCRLCQRERHAPRRSSSTFSYQRLSILRCSYLKFVTTLMLPLRRTLRSRSTLRSLRTLGLRLTLRSHTALARLRVRYVFAWNERTNMPLRVIFVCKFIANSLVYRSKNKNVRAEKYEWRHIEIAKPACVFVFDMNQPTNQPTIV